MRKSAPALEYEHCESCGHETPHLTHVNERYDDDLIKIGVTVTILRHVRTHHCSACGSLFGHTMPKDIYGLTALVDAVHRTCGAVRMTVERRDGAWWLVEWE